jgi:hypothetical protein
LPNLTSARAVQGIAMASSKRLDKNVFTIRELSEPAAQSKSI